MHCCWHDGSISPRNAMRQLVAYTLDNPLAREH
jgi:hypothetical protein